MALVVNDPTVERLAKQLAEATREPVAEAVGRALEERLRRVRTGWRRRGPGVRRGPPGAAPDRSVG